MLPGMRQAMDFLYSLYDAFISVNVPSDKARAAVDAMERDMTTVVATKHDFDSKHLLVRHDIESVRALRASLVVQFGSMLFVGLGLLFAALKLT
jgi:hypothetical protein